MCVYVYVCVCVVCVWGVMLSLVVASACCARVDNMICGVVS